MEDLSGHQLGPYRIVAPLGERGMAAVYKAYQPGMDRYVALKILPRHLAGDPKFARRFEQEARVIANLQHINILPVHDYGQDQGYTFIVMPIVETGTLADLLTGEPLHLSQVQQIISQVGDALDFASTRGVVHRDIKPSNILIGTRGNCLLTDFGISKILSASSTQLTATGDVIGTPAYMSPEQGLGQELDQRSDIYSLGVVLYEMVTGRQPYRAETPMAVIIKHIHDPLPLPHTLNPTIPEAVERVILKALAKERDHRFHTASEMAAAFNSAIALETSQPQEATPTSQLETLTAREQTLHQEPGTINLHTSPHLSQKVWQRIPPWAWGGLAVILTGVLVVVWALNRIEPYPTTSGTELAIVVPTIQSTQEQTKIFTATLIPTGIPAPNQILEVIPSPTQTTPPTITSTPTLHPGATQIVPLDGMTLIYIPSGEFTMGSTDGSEDESPVHTVYLDSFWIDQTEVTVGQYNRCVATGICQLSPYPSPDVPTDYFTNLAYSMYPAVDIPWQNAAAYCNWVGRRLPTEAEWEKAARGTEGLTYTWGFLPQTYFAANYCDRNCALDWKDQSADDGFKYRSPVGNYLEFSSPYGVYDMAGNVWEWVADWYSEDAYTPQGQDNPSGPATGRERVVRGGSWGSTMQNLRTAKRFHRNPGSWFGDVGFRCALTASP